MAAAEYESMNSKIQIMGTQPKRKPIEGEIVVGKDVLELFAGAMYAEPLSTFREYMQNAADSVDDARKLGLEENPHADVSIVFDHAERTGAHPRLRCRAVQRTVCEPADCHRCE
jgi:hypothetical protein